MIVPTLSQSNARAILDAYFAGEQPPFRVEDVLTEAGINPRDDVQSRIDSLTQDLESIIVASPGREVARFDSEAAVICHSHLGELPVRVATESGFWRYLSLGPLRQVVEWRYPGSRNRENFGVGKAWEALPERLWFRAHVAVETGSEDPYRLVRRGGVDFWISGLVRVLYSSNPVLARALVEFQYPNDGEFVGDKYRPATLGTDGIRELYKRLRHFTATVEFPALTKSEALDLVAGLGADLSNTS